MSKALLIIDVQNFYFSGNKALKEPVEASLKAKKLLEHFRKNNLPVYHIKHDIDVSSLSEAEKRIADIHENVKPLANETIIVKKTPGSFKGTLLQESLKSRDIDELVICGMMSHMCVDTTTREAFDLDYKCTVIHDACTTRDLEFKGNVAPAEYVHTASMAALSNFARLSGCEEYLEEAAGTNTTYRV